MNPRGNSPSKVAPETLQQQSKSRQLSPCKTGVISKFSGGDVDESGLQPEPHRVADS